MICTFYSYKGGVGRSMALANVADRLCRYGLKTLIVDFDLEAPGLERYFPIDMQAARQSPGTEESRDGRVRISHHGSCLARTACSRR